MQRLGDALGFLDVADDQRSAAAVQQTTQVGERGGVGVAGVVGGRSGHGKSLAEARAGRIDFGGDFGRLDRTGMDAGPAGWPMHHPADTLE